MQKIEPLPSGNIYSEYITSAAAAIELNVAPAYRQSVYQEFAATAALARYLMEFELDQEVRPAPAFQP